jgi:NTP pyrophosphatase (non-canonical NTP hydrolase)
MAMTTSNSGSGRTAPADEADIGERLNAADQAVWSTAKAALPSLSALQGTALSIYGCLEPERALVWTMEELGELAQVVRRGEGQARLHEELGQLTAWTLCLANILGVDLATAVESAMREETARQIGKYGKLTPYGSGRHDD